jgi:predicted nucleotidyltransferase
MKKYIEKISEDMVKCYKTDKNVLGVMLFGSAARGMSDIYSDIDIYILLAGKGKFSRNNFIKDGKRIDVIFNTFKEVKKYLKEDKNNIKRNTSHMLTYGKILFQKGKVLDKIKKTAQNNLKSKTKYSKDEVLMHKYSIDDFWGEVQRDIKNKDYLAFGLDSQLLINNILELFLKMNGEFLRRSDETGEILRRIDKKFARQISDFYKESNIQKKKNILTGLVGYIYKKTNGPLPPNWNI